MSEDLYGPGISDENEVATILEIKATIATILIKFDSVSPACNDGKETSVARLEFSYFLLPVVVMVVLSSLVALQCKTILICDDCA